ncbi:MAG: hypothetical protein K6F92_03005 [Lachnospiraceae bacterium]|nr:hypothetical protein [Lachnospiraceae bacterium]
MRKIYRIMSMALTVSMLGGCALYEQVDVNPTTAQPNSTVETTSASESESTTEEAQAAETTGAPETETVETTEGLDIVIDIDTPTSSHFGNDNENETIEYIDLAIDRRLSKVMPIDENGVWTDYMLVYSPHDDIWVDEEGNPINVEYCIEDYPGILCWDEAATDKINKLIEPYCLNKYVERFQMWDLWVNLKCTTLNETRFVSFEFAGTVMHDKGDLRYEKEREYRYYFTVDRMTGTVLNLETMYGVMKAYNDIAEGNYTVIRGEDKVFETYDNEGLAKAYVYDPVFTDDLQHELDWYLSDGHICVVIWVGADKGNYAILQLNGTPNYQ